MKEKIQKYKLSGVVSVWKYTENERNFPDWNINADKIARQNLLELLKMMEDCQWPTQKTISIISPTINQLSIPNNRGGNAKLKTKAELILNSKKTAAENHWQIIEHESAVEIQFGTYKLIELKNSIDKRSNGEFDFAICDEDEENILYFW